MGSQQGRGPLAGMKVIDVSRVLGAPYCTQLLGDYGANVIKIESFTGDDTRQWGPPFQDESAAYYMGLNRNKRAMIVDLSKPEGQALLLRLLEDADIFVENFKIGTLERWDLGFEEVLSKRFPRLVHCRVSGFGADGPYGGRSGYDAVIQACAGLMSVNGEKGGEPLRVGLAVVDLVTGLNAIIGILLALQERGKSGEGQFVEAALYDSGISLLHPHMVNYLMGGNVPTRTGNAHVNVTPYDTYKTATIPIFLAVGNNQQFSKLCEAINIPELSDDERFSTNANRNQHQDELKAALESAMAQLDGEVLTEKLIEIGVPCGPILSVDAVAKNAHTKHREMLVKIGDHYEGIGSPIKLSRTPAEYRYAPPKLGEQTYEILREANISEAEIEALAANHIVVDRS